MMTRVTGNGWHLLSIACLAGAVLLMPGLVRSYGLARPVACVLGGYLAVCSVTWGIGRRGG